MASLAEAYIHDHPELGNDHKFVRRLRKGEPIFDLENVAREAKLDVYLPGLFRVMGTAFLNMESLPMLSRTIKYDTMVSVITRTPMLSPFLILVFHFVCQFPMPLRCRFVIITCGDQPLVLILNEPSVVEAREVWSLDLNEIKVRLYAAMETLLATPYTEQCSVQVTKSKWEMGWCSLL